MASPFQKFVRKHNNLQNAWQKIRANGKRSSSPYVTDDIANFLQSDHTNIRSIAAKINHGTYQFGKARGVPIDKEGKPGKIRPIVIPKVKDRIVQRTILDALVEDPKIKELAFQPLSFGGVPKRDGDKLSGVPAAIEALLSHIDNGATHIIVADIKGFFTQIRKSDCVSLISQFTEDSKFLDLFANAISVDLENSAALWRHKADFPYDDIGVGQGVCLSPFLGNLVLAEFDKSMNEDDCACIRYVDDIIIVAPNGKAASAKFRKAKKLLPEGMEFSAEKSSSAPIPVDQKFQYLGIEFYKSNIRPAKTSRRSIVARASEVAAKSLQVMRSAENPDGFNRDYSIPRTLNKISGMAKGWAHHYKFCNDRETILNVDRKISKLFLEYAGKAQTLAQQKVDKNDPDFAAALLGYRGAKEVKMDSLHWPTK